MIVSCKQRRHYNYFIYTLVQAYYALHNLKGPKHELLTQSKHVNECVDDLGSIENNFFFFGGGPAILDFVF
jgi:hypothetical protein